MVRHEAAKQYHLVLKFQQGAMGIVCVLNPSVVSNSATPWAVALRVSPSMEFSRQEHWNGLPFPPSGDLPNPGIEPTSLASPALAGRFFTSVPPGKPAIGIAGPNIKKSGLWGSPRQPHA